MMQISSLFRILIFINKIRFDMFCEKYSITRNQLIQNLFFIFSLLLKFVAVNLLLLFISVFVITDIIQIKWLGIAVINMFVIYYYMFPFVISGEGQKLGFLKYLSSGIFTRHEYEKCVKSVISYYSLSYLTLLGLAVWYINFVTYRMYHPSLEKIFFILFLEHLFLYLYFKALKKKAEIHLFNNLKSREIPTPITNIILLTLFIKYSGDFFHNIALEFNIFYFVLYFTLIILIIFFFDLLTLNNINRYINTPNNNKFGGNIKLSRIINPSNDVRKDFYYREIKPKLNIVVICCVIFKFWNVEVFLKNVIFVIIIIMLTSHYNQRYLLNEKYFDYSVLINDNRKNLLYFVKKLYFYPFIFVTYLSFIINDNYWYIMLNNLILLINMTILTTFYRFQIDLQIEDSKKYKNIEFLTFILLLFELIIVYIF